MAYCAERCAIALLKLAARIIRGLRAEGKLLITPVLPPDNWFENRTLLVSWPMPGSDLPLAALRRYTELGGRRFVFKPGGFIGSSACADSDRVFAFFEYLYRNWVEEPPTHRPLYNPLLLENNMFVFIRKV